MFQGHASYTCSGGTVMAEKKCREEQVFFSYMIRLSHTIIYKPKAKCQFIITT